jgi:hypothetical protein
LRPGWLAGTDFNRVLTGNGWAIPIVQTLHIVGIAIVISSMAMLHGKVLGVGRTSQTLVQLSSRFLPWVWRALGLQLLTGLLLIVAEPARELLSAVFWWKMGLLFVVVGLTVWAHRAILRTPSNILLQQTWLAKVVSALSLLLWLAVITAGRWIAYLEHS